MKKFEYYRENAGKYKPYLGANYVWAAYKSGKVSLHETKDAARKVSVNIEQIETEESVQARKEVSDHNKRVENEAFHAWWYDFQLEYQEMPKKLFDLLYSEAYDKAHSSGHDAIVDKFEELADFAERIINATK